MRLSRLTPKGIATFSEFLDQVRVDGVGELPAGLLDESDSAELVGEAGDVPERTFTDRQVAGEYLDDLLRSSGVDESAVEGDTGLWAWLSARHFSALCAVRSDGTLAPGERARWIPEPSDFRRYYRHLLAGPYLIYRTYRSDPSIARSLLCGAVSSPGDVAEQLVSRMEFVSNRSLVGLATQLYCAPTTGRLKRGAGGSGPGSPRRLAAVINQLDLTWDLYGMSTAELMDMLPAEFDRFKR